MTRPKKKLNAYPKSERSETSLAMLSLREAMGKTQAQFAVEVLHVAVTTVARYETSHSPSDELLLKLRLIALHAERPVEARVFAKAWHAENKAIWNRFSL